MATVTVGEGRADLHVHSWWSDGAQSPEALVRAASGRADVLAVTDHDEIRGALEARAFAREHPALGVEVVVGEEVSTLNGHLLALWVEEAIPPRLTAERTIELIHDQGGLAVAAHPLHPLQYNARGYPPRATLIHDMPLDAIEVVNNLGVSCRLYDAWYVGSAVTRFAGHDAGALRRAIVSGATAAHLVWSWRAGMLPRHVGIKLRNFHRFVRLARRRLAPEAGRDVSEAAPAGMAHGGT